MIELHTWKTPNGRKPIIMLEEVGLPYVAKPVDITAGAQKHPAFVGISPNGKIPAMIDPEAEGGSLALFESGAILTYLADKTGQLLAPGGAARYHAMAWTYWQVGGLGPMFGQLGFFYRQSERNEPAIARYAAESARLLHVLEDRLAASPFLAGDAYSIADIATYPWVVGAMTMMAEAVPAEARNLPATKAWLDTIGARPAVQRGMAWTP